MPGSTLIAARPRRSTVPPAFNIAEFNSGIALGSLVGVLGTFDLAATAIFDGAAVVVSSC